MARIGLILGCGVLAIGLAGCAHLHKMTSPAVKGENTGIPAPLPVYSGPRARLAVADFEVKASKATAQIGSGLREMLLAALVNSGRFSIAQQQSLSAIMQEQELAKLEATGGNNNQQKTKVKAADIVITAIVAEFEPQASGGSAGIGGGGGISSGMMGGLLGVELNNKAHMTMDIRIVDISTSEVLASTRIQGQASDVKGTFTGGSLGNWALGSGLSAYANTPMEKAMRICIIEAARYISGAIPLNYYQD